MENRCQKCNFPFLTSTTIVYNKEGCCIYCADVKKRTFTLSIQLGNYSMNEPWHVAYALEELAKKLRMETNDPVDCVIAGNVYDISGNEVGEYRYDP